MLNVERSWLPHSDYNYTYISVVGSISQPNQNENENVLT